MSGDAAGNRIDRCFLKLAAEGRTALIPFITAGDPDPDWTSDAMHGLVEGGADVLEIGIPFSDPMADGPVIQAASERAIQRGMNLSKILDCVALFRRRNDSTPVVLMGYLNPIERFGYEAFASRAAEAGVDGVLLVDCPPEELKLVRTPLDEAGIHPICLVAPTTTAERMRFIADQAAGYLYYVSFKGITGANQLEEAGLEEPLSQLRQVTDLPIAVGFGIKSSEQAAAVATLADGVVIGSALVEHLATASSEDETIERARAFLAPVREAMDNA